MDFAEFKRRLQSSPTFHDLEHWTITDTDSGLTSPNSYRFQCDGRDYFVKEIKENEKRILEFLARFELKIAPKIVCPELLEQDIAVYEYVRGTPIKGKMLPQELIGNYALLQNILNQEHIFQQADALNGYTFASVDSDSVKLVSIDECRHDIPPPEWFSIYADSSRCITAPARTPPNGAKLNKTHHDHS